MPELADGDWALTYPGTEVIFGGRTRPVFNATTPELGDTDLTVSVARVPRGDGAVMGVDFRGGRTLTFAFGTRPGAEVASRAALADLATAWRADAVRTAPGAVAELRCRYRGEERVVFGRPRKFAPELGKAGTQGRAEAAATFECVDDVFHGGLERSLTLALAAVEGGGFTVPMTWPLVFGSPTDRSQAIEVGGDIAVRPRIEITGPVTNPEVEVVGCFRAAFALTLAYDEVLVLDARTWARAVTIGAASAAGALTRTSTRLGSIAIPPGTYPLVFRGMSPTGTATARVSWRTAHPTP